MQGRVARANKKRGFDVLRPIWSSEIPSYHPAREAPWTFSELWLLLCNIWHVDINAEALHPPRSYAQELVILIFLGQSYKEGKFNLKLSDPLTKHSFAFIKAPLSSSKMTLSESRCYCVWWNLWIGVEGSFIKNVMYLRRKCKKLATPIFQYFPPFTPIFQTLSTIRPSNAPHCAAQLHIL